MCKKKKTKKEKVKLPDGSKIKAYDVNRYENGNLKNCILVKPKIFNTPLGELKLGATLVDFYDDGTLKGGYLYKPKYIKMKPTDIRINGYIGFYKTGELEWIDLADAHYLNTPTGEKFYSIMAPIHLSKEQLVLDGLEYSNIDANIFELNANRPFNDQLF